MDKKPLNTFQFLIKIKNYINKIAFPEYLIFSFYSILIGASAGLAAVLFHLSIEFFNKIFFVKTKEGLYFLGAAAVILLPAFGMYIQSLMIYFAPEISKKRGVPEIIKSVALKGGFIKFRTTIFHFFAPVICIGSGGTVGPEGPAAQLGGGVASKISTILNFSDQRRRVFTAAGAGAAISAIFNTPLGGVFFALEIILLNDFHTPTFSALILASVTASAISRIILGNESIFSFDIIELVNYQYFYLFILLGLLSGLTSVLFLKYNDYSRDLFTKSKLRKFPRWITMVSVGLLVGVAGYLYKDIFGIGYEAINNILKNEFSWQIVATLFILKFLLVPLVINSGGFGGTFAPSLFMGACAGYLFAISISAMTGLEVDKTTYILVGMGAFLGGLNSIPITAILMIFEMTREYSIILPLMLSVIVSSTIVQIVFKGSYHQKLLEKEGFKLTYGRESNILKSILIEEVYQKDFITVKINDSLNTVVSKLLNSPYHVVYTVDDEMRIIGAITQTELRPLITEYESLKETLIAQDITNSRLPKLFLNNDLDQALKLLTKEDIEELPIVDSNNHFKLIGSISRNAILAAYNKESIKHNISEGLTRELNTLEQNNISHIAKGYSIIEKKPRKDFIGRSLTDLKIRNKFGLEIIMLKKSKELFNEDIIENELIMPSPDYIIEEDDILVLFGTDEKIEKTNEW